MGALTRAYEIMLAMVDEPAWQECDDDANWLAEIQRRAPGETISREDLHAAQRRLIALGRAEYVGNKGVRGLPRQTMRPEAVGEMSTIGDLVEAFHERRRGWPSAVEAALLACEALATAEESPDDSTALERAEGAVEELEATIGAEAAHWWRRRLRDLQRERDASIAESVT